MMKQLALALNKALDQYLLKFPGASVLDFGCGSAPYRPLIERYGARYVGADIPRNTDADIHFDPAGHLPIEQSTVDLVLSSQVLEHVIDVDAYLEECHRVLRTNGILLLSTHGMWIYHPFPYDVRRWTWWGLRHELEKHAFEVVSWQGILGPLAYTTQLRLQLVRGLLYQLGKVGEAVVPLVCVLSQGLMAFEDLITPKSVGQENSAVYFMVATKKAT